MKAAVIGTGVISEQHLQFLRGRDDVDVVGVADLSPIAGKVAAERYGAGGSFTDYRTMLERTSPDVVHICTPPATHERMVIDCLDAGAHVLCEKPLTLAHDKLGPLQQRAADAGRALVEDHNYRFNRPVAAIRKMIDSGELGQVQEVEVRMALGIRGGGRYASPAMPHPSHKLPAGVIHEFITHLSYLTLAMLPVPEGHGWDRVAAAWSNHGPVLPPLPPREGLGEGRDSGDSTTTNRADTAQDRPSPRPSPCQGEGAKASGATEQSSGGDPFKYDDLDALVIAGESHARIRFSCRTGPDTFAITVRGSEGWASTDLFQPHLTQVRPRLGGDQLSPIVNHVVNGVQLARSGAANLRDKLLQRTAYEGLHALLEQTYDALRDGHTPPVSPADVDAASRLVDALLAEENRL